MLILGVWYVNLMATLFVLVCLLMMAVILIQKPRGGGLSGAFGGAGGSAQSAFGAKTGDFLTWLTVGFFIAFLLLAIGLTWAIPPSVNVTKPTMSATPGTPTTPGSSGSTGSAEPLGSPTTVPAPPEEEAPKSPATTRPSDEVTP